MPALHRFLPLLLLAACSDGVEYSLDLDIITPGNQDPFANLDRLVLTLEPERGSGESFELSSTSGNPQLERLGALTNTRIALEGYVGDELVSFGRTVSLSMGDGDTRTEPVLMAEVDAFAWMGELDIGRGIGAAASDGQGGFFVFGGANDLAIGSGDGTSAVFKINIAPPDAALSFEQVAALPDYEAQQDRATHSERVGHTATLLTEGPNAGKILITGGSAAYIELNTTTYDAALFNPATLQFETLAGAMSSSRSSHTAVMNQNGDVVLIGGWGSGSANSLVPRDSAEIYDVDANDFSLISGSVPGEGIYGAGASIGTKGVLYCGGATLLGGTWESSDECITISVSREIASAASLDIPLAQHAMATLADGTVLLTGGLSIEASDAFPLQFESTDASDGAWLYDPGSNSWSEAETAMLTARAYHRIVPLPDGQALIIGGSSRGELFYSDNDNGGDGGLACAELYTPGVGFTKLDPNCGVGSATGDLPAQMQFPVVTDDPTYGVMVIGGIDGSLRGAAGTALWVGTPSDR